MNIHEAGSNLSATSTFEQNMNDLTSSLNTTFGGLRMFKQAGKSIKKPTSYGKPSNSESSLAETSTAPSPTRLYTGSSVTSSSSSFSSSSSTTNLVLSLSFLSLTSPAEEEATDNHLSRRLIQSSALEVPAVSYSTEASGGIGASSALVTHATKSESTVSPTNKVKGSMQLDSDDTSLSTLRNIVLEPEGVQVANRRDKENTLLNQDFNDDEGFASGDESTDDNEPDNDNPGLNLSLTNRNITETKDNKVGVDSSQGRVDNRLFNATVDGDTIFGFVERMEGLESMLFNATWYNENSSTYNRNDSTYNDTYVLVAEGMYPSGYSLLQIVLASIAAIVLMVVVVVGNMLVIIAIATEKALKNIQNWFIASLAVADFFLGLVIMPFSLANEIMGYWIFGYLWCDIYSAMDVLLCTASIMNLCLISLDRFWSITQAIEYLKKRTPARAALMITLVWLLSALVCIPPLLGWKRPQPAEEYPKCSLSEDIGYVLYSALGSFYIPSCIMVFVYIKIYFAAKARARRGIRKQPRPRVVIPPESPDIRQTSFTQSTPATDSRKTPGTMDNVATIENQPVMIPIVTCDFASDVSTSEADPGGDSLALEEKDTLKVTMPMLMQKTNLKASLSVNGSGDTAVSSLPPRCRAPSVGIDVDMVSEFDPSSSDSGVVSRCAVVKPLKLRLCRPIFGRKAIGKLKREHADPGKHSAKDTQEDTKPPKPRDPEREKKRLARKKEKRATLILGLIMGSFIVCWLPFFFLYIVKPVFPSLEIPAQASAIAFWLGYMNSALNPVIYTVFNKDFRRAFRRILYK